MSSYWCGWGDPNKTFSLEDRPNFWPTLISKIGRPSGGRLPIELGMIALPTRELGDCALFALRKAIGDVEAIKTDTPTRLRHAYGKSYRDLVRLRAGEIPNPPSAVAFPSAHTEVVATLKACRNLGLPVVPFGGGTSVVGGVEGPPGPYLVLALARLNRLLAVDLESRLARLEAGILGPELERLLALHDLTLGHFPQSFEYSTLGGWIATRSAGQQSTRYGKIEEMVVALRLATPEGELTTPTVPAASDGPDLNRFISGSEGTFGVITEAVMRVRPRPAHRNYVGFLLPSFESGYGAIRQIIQAGARLATIRLSDSAETEATFTLRQASRPGLDTWARHFLKQLIGPLGERCLLILGFEGEAREIRAELHLAGSILHRAGAVTLGEKVGQEWYRHRFDLPYLRDVLMDRGVMVDTLETAAIWSKLDGVYQAVCAALRRELAAWGTPASVFCHISHAYEVGASLYFTFIARQDLDHPLEQWWTAKQAATDAIVAAGAALSHHHGIGREHSRWWPAVKGVLGLALVRNARRTLDPQSLLNPGLLDGRADAGVQTGPN